MMMKATLFDVLSEAGPVTGEFRATRLTEGPNYQITAATVGPDQGPPPHVITDADTAVYVVTGSITFHVDDESIPVPAGHIIVISSGANRKLTGGPEGATILATKILSA